MSTPQQVSISERRIDLDWVRILAFGLLIFYHVCMLYVSWRFHIKSDEIARRIAWLRPLFGLRMESRSVGGIAQQQPA
ncbi:hypothetical protein [Bradyrhizobium cytisi]|uniref:hypothetical protein n=1 Tax=Bradyrhizobium cytisi TaxID=515489 RepID=UPI001FE83F1F|nr:hypothetical protein [Bradyrhizobium cytisi]